MKLTKYLVFILALAILLVSCSGSGNSSVTTEPGDVTTNRPEDSKEEPKEDPDEEPGDVWDGSIADGFSGGSGTAEDPYLISTGAQLAYLAREINTVPSNKLYNKHYSLTCSISLGDLEWDPIGCYLTDRMHFGYSKIFEGTFNGNGHSVTNFKITTPRCEYYEYFGLFGRVHSGSILNLSVKNFKIDIQNAGDIHVGGLFAYAEKSSVTNCYALGEVSIESDESFDNSVGMFAGCLVESTVENCRAKGSVISENSTATDGKVGGLIGQVWQSKINASYSSVNIDLYESAISNFKVGGFAGSMQEVEIFSCHASGNVVLNGGEQSSFDAGGFVGELFVGTLDKCYSTGNVSATESNSTNCGGFSGLIIASGVTKITGCYSTGDVVAYSNHFHATAGGFAGYIIHSVDTTVQNCYSTGNVIAKNITGLPTYPCAAAGGFIGYTYRHDDSPEENITVSRCYATGNVQSEAQYIYDEKYKDYNDTQVFAVSGGLIGETKNADVINCYATGNVSSSVTSDKDASAISEGLVAVKGNGDLSGCYYYFFQSVKSSKNGEITMSPHMEGTYCLDFIFDSKSFYTDYLGYKSTDGWDLSDLDFKNGKYPKLKYE